MVSPTPARSPLTAPRSRRAFDRASTPAAVAPAAVTPSAVLVSTWVFLGLIVCGMAGAVAPGQVTYQGLLLDTQGEPVTDIVALNVEIFDAASNGNSLWTENHPSVPVVDGVYSVELGSTTPITAAILASGSVFLEVSVDGEILTPRQRLLAVPYAIEAGRADDANQLGGLSGQFFVQLLEDVSFDGGDPPNLDPQEGAGDVDGDGLANFVDPDNDGDGLSDIAELGNSDINLITPTITGFSPSTANGLPPTLISILGTNFTADSVVLFGTANPAIENFAPNQIDVIVGGQPLGDAAVSVTRPNGESAASTYPFFLTTAVIDRFEDILIPGQTGTVRVIGENFVPGMTVQFGSQNPVPSNVTPTSFDVTVGPFSEGPLTVTVVRPNSTSVQATYEVTSQRFLFVTSTGHTGNQGGLAGLDAICTSDAAAAGLNGRFQAWASSNAASPSTRLNLGLGPYLNTAQQTLATDWADLTDGTLANPVIYDANGGPGGSAQARTGTTASGELAAGPVRNCSDWTTDQGVSYAGIVTATNSTWSLDSTIVSCSMPLLFYCIGN